MEKRCATHTPTQSIAPTPSLDSQPHAADLYHSPVPQPDITDVPPVLSPPVAPGFEIDFGPVTVTDLDISNPAHLTPLAVIISVLVAAKVYRDALKSKARKTTGSAYQTAEATFGQRIDRLAEETISLTPPKKVGLWDSVLNRLQKRTERQQAEMYKRFMQDIQQIRTDIESFHGEYGGQIDERLEDAVQYLYEVTAAKPPNLDALVSALQRVRTVAKRLNLGRDSLHFLDSVTFQLGRLLEQ